MQAPKIADWFTLGNVVAGTLSIMHPEPMMAALLIGIGVVFDVLDGFVARLLKQQSEIGIQLDSLADMITFGVAPALILYRIMPDHPLILPVVLLIPMASAWRLAQFNLLPASPWFAGLPTPANALWYVGLALWLPDASGWYADPNLHLGASVLLSLMMVTGLPIPGVKSIAVLKENWWIPGLGLVGLFIPMLLGLPMLFIQGFLVFFLVGCFIRKIIK